VKVAFRDGRLVSDPTMLLATAELLSPLESLQLLRQIGSAKADR
jgi:hypothetical protein